MIATRPSQIIPSNVPIVWQANENSPAVTSLTIFSQSLGSGSYSVVYPGKI